MGVAYRAGAGRASGSKRQGKVREARNRAATESSSGSQRVRE